jgi:phosphotransferase system enzyme I (PtsI)
MFLGTAASPGIAIGRARLMTQNEFVIHKATVQNADVEINRLRAAIEMSKAELELLKSKALSDMGQDKADIFEAHLMMLQDPDIIEQVEARILSEKLNAEFAYKEMTDQFIEVFKNMKNEYMRERASDVKDVAKRVLSHLVPSQAEIKPSIDQDWILVGHDFTPSETASFDRKHVLGFLTDIGGRTSHTAIMARTLEIPAVVGSRDLSQKIQDGDLLVIDGDSGEVFVNPEITVVEKYEKERARQNQLKEELNQMIGEPTTTRDGRSVELAGNIGTLDDLAILKKGDAEGVGLFRTEFIYMNRDTYPTEDEQFEIYKKVLESTHPHNVIIRTMDIGGDKSLPYLSIPKEMNPFLGYRAIRISLDRPEIFKTQLRALLRASPFGRLRIMFPMISSIEEIRQAKRHLDDARKELLAEGHVVAEDIPVGIMIEIPAAVMIADLLAQEVDFFSIGTNDLIQYACAVDRMNEKIHHLYSSYNPGVLRMINHTIQEAHKAGIWVGMCGEVAGELPLIPVLLGMGLDEFSMSPTSILKVRKLICTLSFEDSKKLANQVLNLGTSEEIESLLSESFKL